MRSPRVQFYRGSALAHAGRSHADADRAGADPESNATPWRNGFGISLAPPCRLEPRCTRCLLPDLRSHELAGGAVDFFANVFQSFEWRRGSRYNFERAAASQRQPKKISSVWVGVCVCDCVRHLLCTSQGGKTNMRSTTTCMVSVSPLWSAACPLIDRVWVPLSALDLTPP